MSERADRGGRGAWSGGAARRSSRKLVICVTSNAQKRDSEESCGRVGRRRMYIRLPS